MMNVCLLAIKIERRSMAIAVFSDTHPSYTQARELSSAEERATASVVAFLHWALATFRVESAVAEQAPTASEIRRNHLSQAVLATLRDAGVPVWQTGKQTLFDSFGLPPLKSRKEVRAVVAGIWPILGEGRRSAPILDAVALGLHFQTERLFHQ